MDSSTYSRCEVFSSSDVGLAFLATVRVDSAAFRAGDSLGRHGEWFVMFCERGKWRRIKVL